MITNITTGETIINKIEWCDTFWTRLRGLMFRPALDADTALLFVEKEENIVNTTIHMFFMRFDIAVVWLDAQKIVVDKTLARAWRPYYAPRKPAKYFLEAVPALLDKVSVGDQLVWED